MIKILPIIVILSLLLSLNVQADNFRCRLEWAHTVDLRAFDHGVVEKVNVLEGDQVKKDQVLISLEKSDFEFEIKEVKARLQQAQAVLSRAQRELSWEEELFEQGSISQNELDDYIERHLGAKARVAELKASLNKAELSLERSDIKAPFDGIITAQRAWKGETIIKTLQKDPLIELARYDQMVARIRVSANDIGTFRVNRAAEVRIGNRLRNGYIYRIGTISEGVIEHGLAYAVDVIFDVFPKEALRPGQPCIVNFNTLAK